LKLPSAKAAATHLSVAISFVEIT